VERTTFVIDRDGSIKKIWRGVNVVGHADEVLQFASSLQ
jgi:peroxiredoxin Q/BCP